MFNFNIILYVTGLITMSGGSTVAGGAFGFLTGGPLGASVGH